MNRTRIVLERITGLEPATFALPLGYGTVCGAVDEIRTRDIHRGKVALYH